MKTEELDKWFEDQAGSWDLAEPTSGHQERFLEKMQASQIKEPKVIRLQSWFRPLLAIASVVAVIVLLFAKSSGPTTKDLASVSPEMEKTQDFFTMAIEEQLYQIQQESNPETKVLVSDALNQLKSLEEDYDLLKKDLAENGENKGVIYAMITNFQTRIDLLKDVLEKIESTKRFKSDLDENKLL